MEKKKLTILTEPITITYKARTLVQRMLGRRGRYGGHPARTKRIIEGLEAINFTDFNYQPSHIKDLAEHVHVMSNVNTLKWAIDLKKKGIIKKLTAGPNIVVFADEYDSIITDEAIDLYLQPSEWSVEKHIAIEPSLKGRCVSFPFSGVGMNLKEYVPKNYDRKNKVLIYHKDEGIQMIYRIQYMLKQYGYESDVITYGKYKVNDYIEAVSRYEFMVAVGRQESGGNYLTEAWAMDTPTICFDPHYYKWTIPYEYEMSGNISTCPYLTEATGTRFYEMHELEEILKNIDEYKAKWHPRKWVEENMTIENCSRLFLETIGIQP